MNCYPNVGSVTIPQQRPLRNLKSIVEPGIDLNPYLNFLLDLNTLNLTGISQVPVSGNTETSLPPNSIPVVVSPSKSQFSLPGPSRTSPWASTSALSTKEITTRLDRLEVKLSKIVNQRSSRHCLTPVTTDEEENGSPAPLHPRKNRPGNFKSQNFGNKTSRQRTGRDFKLLPPESFEGDELDVLADRIPSRKSIVKVQKNVQQSVTEAKLEREVKTEQERRTKLEVELSTSQAEIQKLKAQAESAKDKTSEIQDQIQKLKTSLGEECQLREKAEENLRVHTRLASCLNVKLQATQQRELQLQATLSAKEAALATLAFLKKENEILKIQIERLSTVTQARKVATHQETDRRSLDDAIKKATSKFTKFHQEEVHRFERQLRNSREVIQDLEEQLQAAAAKDAELTQLRTAFSRMELSLNASKSREELQERRVAELIDRASHAEEAVRRKEGETEKLLKVIGGLRKELDRLKNTVAGLHVEKTSLLNFTATVDEEQKRCGRLQQEKATLQEKVEKFDEERRSLRKEVEDMVQTLKEKHQVELRTHEEVVERLKTDLAVQVEGAKVKEKINDNLQETIEKLRRTIECSSQKFSSPSADTEHYKRRNRELEEVLERLEDRKEELKTRLASTEAQLQESNKAHQIVNAKWKEKSAYITRLQTDFATLQARFEVKEEELTEERDRAEERVQTLQAKVEELNLRSRQLRQVDIQNLKKKYEEQLARKATSSAKIQQHNQELEERLKELTEDFSCQKKEITGKFSRLGRFLQDFENDS